MMDVFGMETNSATGSIPGLSKKSATNDDEDEDYMELYVTKELKDKITPIDEDLAEKKTQIEQLFEGM